jgi:hypothetical protein
VFIEEYREVFKIEGQPVYIFLEFGVLQLLLFIQISRKIGII